MNLRSVDLNLLVTLEAVVAERSVSRAANRLGLTQSAVSHALRRLRKVFGDPLLVRGRDGMEPTQRGLEITREVTQALARIEQVINEHQHFDPRTSVRAFTLRISDYVAPFLLPSLCSALRSQAPRLTLRVAHFDPDDEDGRIGPNEFHVRLHRDRLPGATGLRLLDDEFVVLCSGDRDDAEQPMTLERYLTLPHVKVAQPALGTNMIDDALARRGLQRNIALTVPSWFEMRGVIANTDLVVAMPRRWASDPAFSTGCVWHPLPLEEVTFAMDLLWRSRDARDPGHRWLCDLIVRAARTWHRPLPSPGAERVDQII
jgi:DNA-binding transcriptional LysR family regulator